MKIIIKSKEQLYEDISNVYIEQIKKNPNSKLGFVTGATPLPLYELLIKSYKKGNISFKNIRTFNMDEYVNMDKNHKDSYYTYMNNNLFSHVNINLKNTYFPPIKEEEINSFEKIVTFASN